MFWVQARSRTLLNMRSSSTILAFLLLAAFAGVLRVRWSGLSRRAKVWWVSLAALGIVVRSLMGVSHWEFSNSRINDGLLWAPICGYVVLAVLFTCLRPRRFTVPAAFILLLPLFSASVYLRLQYVFDPTPRRVVMIGDRLVFEETAWQRDEDENRAVDYTVSRRSRLFPFFQRNLRAGRLYRTQCDIDAMTATRSAAGRVLLFCPAGAPGESPFVDDVPPD